MINLIVILLLWVCLISYKIHKSLHMLQQNLYNSENRYLKWIVNNCEKVFLRIDVMMIIFIPLLVYIGSTMLNTIIFALLLILSIYKYNIYKKEDQKKEKKPLVFTKRIMRLTITITILLLIMILPMFIWFREVDLNVYYIKLITINYLIYFIVFFANVVNIPVEKYVYHSFKSKAMKKLKSMPNLKMIGITGSYGKTSSKNILSDILNIKYNALPTPRNLNTPYGLIITINNHLDKFDDIMIAEMGAYKIGEIKELCDLVHPKYGILTKIGTAHLESFGSEENIQKGKFELIESLPEDGACVLNMDDEKQLNYKIKSKCKKIWIAIDNKKADFVAKNIKMSNKGTEFDVEINGEKVHFTTKLLGYNNIYNILAGIALGNYFGITNEELQRAVNTVKAVEHRLELRANGDITYIDDSYNSNPIGSKMALDVLNLMEGKKVVITPGMIELGKKQYELNYEFGENISKICDDVILVGKKQTKPIQDALEKNKFDKEHIYIVDDVKDGFNIINNIKDKHTYVLIENDLPEIKNE